MIAGHFKHQAGNVTIIIAICLTALIAGVGLAIDSGLGYMNKAKLNAAVDSAALAGIRAVVLGQSEGEQRISAKEAVEKFFDVNYIANSLTTTTMLNAPTVAFEPSGTIIVDVSAKTTMPTKFMRVLGLNSLDIGASAQTVRRDLDLVFVVDTSYSIKKYGNGNNVIKSAKYFLQRLSGVSDRVALVEFAQGAQVLEPFKADQSRGFNYANMEAHINSFDFDGGTNTPEALWHARDQLRKLSNPSSLQVIVLFTDGGTNAVSSKFEFSPNSACLLTPGNVFRTGTLIAGDYDKPFESVAGLKRHDVAKREDLSPKCFQGPNAAPSDQILSDKNIFKFPDYYNAHDAGVDQISFNSQTRVPNLSNFETMTTTQKNEALVTAANNVVESLAKKIRQEGILILTIGLGDEMNKPIDNLVPTEFAESVLKCIANTPDARSDCFTATEPVGFYCFADGNQPGNSTDLERCYDRVARKIVRISK